MENYVIIYNPFADNNKGLDNSRRLEKILKGNQLQYQDITLITNYADFFAKTPADSRMVLCGGDGTLNRFINDTRDININRDIYYYPCGNGNDFSTDLGKKENSEPFCINPYLVNLPTVEVNGKEYKFLNNVGFGIDGYCCEVGDEMKANGEVNIKYSSIAVKGILGKFKPLNATVTVDGKTHNFKKVWLAPAMNGRYYGGGMNAAPEQQRLDSAATISVLVMHNSGKLKTMMVFPSIFKGEHVKHTECVTVLKGHDITVEFDRPTALQIDGETILNVTKYHATKN